MAKCFSGIDHLQLMARRLVFDFAEAAGAGHPGLIGAARETPARLQLERVLPGNIGIGSGIVIDSFGGQSKQQDIVVFEKHLCPVFSINDTPEATYYPVEGLMQATPYALFVSAGNDGTGAVREIDRIANGYGWKPVAEPVISRKAVSDADLEACRDLGEAMATGLALGIF